MKTLDEVIEKCQENVDLVARGWDEEDCFLSHEYMVDALHYLKAFRNAKDALDAEREKTIEAYCKLKDAREKLEAQTSQMMWVDKHFQFEIPDNPPITWDELKTMEGKPVWVKVDGYIGHWSIVDMITPHLFARYYAWLKSPDDPMRAPVAELNEDNYGKTWQAYRKERTE